MKRLLLAVSPGEIWAAATEDGVLVGLRLIRSVGEAREGDIYLGRVSGKMPNIEAWSVEIGLDRPAFLAAKHRPKGTQVPDGQAILVEVVKEARADKAAAVSMKLSRPAERGSAVTPSLIDRRQTPLAEALQAFGAVEEIVIDDAASVAQARHIVPDVPVELHRDATPLFEAHGVAGAVESALALRIALPKGGAVAIETTAAATLIDVDSGGASPLAANLAAAKEIARQIALRDLSGAIVIDFIGMKRPEDRARIRAALASAAGRDLDMHLLGWTRLGHFELTRKRRRPSLSELLYDTRGAEPAKLPLAVALDALRALQREARAAPSVRFGLRVHPEIAACLAGVAHGALHELEAALGVAIPVVAETRPRDNYAVTRA